MFKCCLLLFLFNLYFHYDIQERLSKCELPCHNFQLFFCVFPLSNAFFSPGLSLELVCLSECITTAKLVVQVNSVICETLNSCSFLVKHRTKTCPFTKYSLGISIWNLISVKLECCSVWVTADKAEKTNHVKFMMTGRLDTGNSSWSLMPGEAQNNVIYHIGCCFCQHYCNRVGTDWLTVMTQMIGCEKNHSMCDETAASCSRDKTSLQHVESWQKNWGWEQHCKI